MNSSKLFLVVEDDKQIRSFISFSLKTQDYKIIEASTGEEALSAITSNNLEVIILDLGLPDMDGLDIIKRVRKFSQTPIIVVSGRDQDKEKIDALDFGADDYITKPFSVNELLARIRVILRHSAKEESSNITLYKIGDLEINISNHTVFKKEIEIHLTPMEFDIIKILVNNCGKVLTHSYLLKQVWGSYLESDTQSLRVFMANIRRKIEDDPTNPKYIITEVGIGYRFVGEL
ncbi:two-component system KDP operon response regulator KdpE [Hydrogenoanaerobacterium saccharovorans]|uniref:Stage 0 sporulation protein A homolog n=1 Tax=Hydrogenoanaerobacterium saccharovorans TaxID=474960 RepID=A0A1H8BN32_9FIRM|nr:response regulator transcription factor [Hydrogenoanaerobacterium saccharovorans]RPF47351.1 two-component system KDP operon response regulator KdpE [Hydrogenoanaerobacterium saccharovorans]SEM83544.1 two-component system, OmpR family, KDP operon response regulator KdpE [Hydrogenoanaerobacterium saccharovorans]